MLQKLPEHLLEQLVVSELQACRVQEIWVPQAMWK